MKENEASSTAFTVLQGLLFVAQKQEFKRLVTERNQQVGEAILNSSKEGQKRLAQIKSGFGRLALPILEKLLLPNISVHYALRKSYIESKVREAIELGATQVINLGAGFDTLLYRLAEKQSNLNCIEIDHPATHAVKKQALTQESMALDNLHFLPVDFTHQTLEEELGKADFFDGNQQTVCIVEGVLMYLTTEQIYHLFKSLVSLIHTTPRHLAFTAVEPPSNHPESYGPLLKIYLKFKGEPLNWLCEENELKEFMDQSDFTLLETANGEDFRTLFLPEYQGPLHRGEFGAFACSTKDGAN